MPEKMVSIRAAQVLVDDWITTTGVRYFSELTNMAILTEEVGEVARLMSRQYGDQSFSESDKKKGLADGLTDGLADELADVLWVLLCIANQTGVDLETALEKNFEKKSLRDAYGIRRIRNYDGGAPGAIWRGGNSFTFVCKSKHRDMEAIVKILDITEVTHDVRRYRIEKPAGYHFNPGQATDVSINLPRWKGELRPISNSPSKVTGTMTASPISWVSWSGAMN